jgi:hypothetical protein
VGVEEASDDGEKVQVLLSSFFPKMSEQTLESTTSIRKEIPWAPVTALEIERALKAAKRNIAPGEDGLPTIVWKNIWTFISHLVVQIFTASSNPRYYPRKWKTATIVVFRKPGEPDYSILNKTKTLRTRGIEVCL